MNDWLQRAPAAFPGERFLRLGLAALERGPLSPDEERWTRDFGRAVHG